MRLFWLLFNLFQGVWVALWTAACVTIALLAYLVTRSRRLGLFLARRLWAPGILAAGPAPVEVQGLENLDLSQAAMGAQAYFFASNHLSFVDVPALFVALPVPLLFLGKAELSRVPFLGWYMSAMGMVFIDRSGKARSARSIENVTRRLQEGWSLVSFPEGTRSPDGSVRRFRSATFASALDTGVPVVPVAIAGADRVLPRSWIGARPGRIRVHVGVPIPTEGLSRGDRATIAERTQQAVEALLARNPRPDPSVADSGLA